MKKKIFLRFAVILTLTLGSMLFVNLDHRSVEGQQGRKVEGKFEQYRKAIKDAHQIDIKNFKDTLKGGYADGKAVTDYDLKQLLTGIKVEMEHTSNRFVALELAMDYLERIPNYYEKLSRLETQVMAVEGREVQKPEGNFERYRKTISDAFQIDIKNFKEKLRGGMADGKPVTRYDLGELLEGIKWERQHANDSFIALELVMDHLERIPDYYSRLCIPLERACFSERFLEEIR